MKPETINKSVLILLVVFISALFLSMIRHFLMALFLAGIFAALAHPLYRRFESWLRGRRAVASLLTLLIVSFGVLLPLGGLLGVVTAQAINVGKSVKPWIEKQLAGSATTFDFIQNIPFIEHIAPYQDEILKKAGEMVGKVSSFLIEGLSSATMGTVNFLFMLFVLLYTMFFFLMDGDKLLQKILYYLPLDDRDERRMLDRFTSVTRATLKGTAIIGIVQGGLAGAAFAVVGIPSAVFWGTIMAVLSIIPAVGSGLVWFPAVIILAANGYYLKAAGLGIFCALVVGSADNLLRPILVGKDTQMHELFIFFGTMGGLALFGIVGFIIGPIIAALFVTVWDIYGMAFRDVLPEVGAALSKRRADDDQNEAGK